MNIVFKNTTKYTKEELNKFMKFHTNKYIWKYIGMATVLTVYFLILIIYNIAYKNWVAAIGSVLITIVICLYYRNVYVSKKQENNKKQMEQEFTFLFYEKYMEICSRQTRSRVKYSKFYKIYETNTDFYLYYNKEYSLLLSKSGFTKGTPEEFTNFIKKKTLFKYKLEEKIYN